MLSLTKVKYLKSLHQKKYRRREGKIILEGFRLIDQALKGGATLEEVWMSPKGLQSELGKQLKSRINSEKIPFSKSTDPLIRQVSDSNNDQGVIALASIPRFENPSETTTKALYLDGISDPGNLGTLLRTAAWFGITTVYLSPDSVDPFNSKVVRSAMGAHFYFTHLDNSIGESILEQSDQSCVTILGADQYGEPLNSIPNTKTNNWILVLGSEARGIRTSVQKLLTHKVAISGCEGMESLNVSVAGGIILNTLIFG